MGYFVSNGKYTKGNWENTFKIKSVEEEKQNNCNIKFDNWTANSLSISPMGITLVGRGQYNDLQKINISANMTDGSVKRFESVRSYSDKGEVKLKFTSSLPLNVSNVVSVTVDGNDIDFN